MSVAVELTEQEKVQLKNLLFSPQLKVLEHLIALITDELRSRSKVGDDEWQTICKAVGDDGEERGLKRLLQEVYNFAQQSK